MNRSQHAARLFVKRILDSTGLSPTELARRAALAPSTLNRFLNNDDVKHTLSARTLMRIAAVGELVQGDLPNTTTNDGDSHKDIQHMISYLLDDAVDPKQESISETNLQRRSSKRSQSLLSLPSPQLGAQKVPVLGVAVGGEDGVFDMNGNPIDRVERPHSLQNVKDGYAVYMVGDSMEPKYEAGQLLYVHPNRPPRRLDYVVIEFNDGRALVKRFVSHDDKHVVLRQFNPARDLTFALADVKLIHKIVTADESR